MARPTSTHPPATKVKLPNVISTIPAAMVTVTAASTREAPRRSASTPTGRRATMSQI